MKKYKIIKTGIAVCLALGLLILPPNRLNVRADEVMATVTGTVLSGTTSSLLKLSTKEGDMEIKLDSGTDASGCKILLPDKEINVSVSHGSDGYLHAVKITTDTPTVVGTLDMSTTATVTGTIGDKTKGDVIYFNTPQGEMQIKLDTTTSISGCALLVMGNSYSITCARGADAYMHAINISDPANVVNTANAANTPAAINGGSMAVTGTVAESTKEDRLYLSTNEGEMQFLIDSNADTGKGMVLTPGNKVTVSFNHGSDGYLHAVGIVGDKDSSSAANIDTSSTVSVSGTVGSKSNQNVLYLDTKQGQMELKLDALSSLNNCKVLVSGRKLTVSCAYGKDAYMHAITITAN